jgi:hypothetical protein
MRVMTSVIVTPNLQQIELKHLRYGHKYNEGEDPHDERTAATANWTAHDIEIISNFRKLRILEISRAGLNGRYPFLFNSFPLLQILDIQHCNDLKWDLGMLAAFPLLKELYCGYHFLTHSLICEPLLITIPVE